MAEAAQSYEQARDELASVVAALEAGGLTLEECVTLWERGEHLAAVCQEWLDGVRARIDRDENGVEDERAATGPPNSD